jgi:hypothetical protein
VVDWPATYPCDVGGENGSGKSSRNVSRGVCGRELGLRQRGRHAYFAWYKELRQMVLNRGIATRVEADTEDYLGPGSEGLSDCGCL